MEASGVLVRDLNLAVTISDLPNSVQLNEWLTRDPQGEILPSRKLAIMSLAKLVKSTRASRHTPGDVSTPSESKRYMRKLSKTDFPALGDSGIRLSLYISLLPVTQKHKVKDILHKLGIYVYKSSALAYDCLKQLSEVSKKYGELLFKDTWMYLVNLETMWGYNPSKDINEFEDDIRQWITGDKVHTFGPFEGQKGIGKFIDAFSTYIKEFFSLSPSKSSNIQEVSPRLFAESPLLWAGPGATTTKTSISYSSNNKQFTVKKNKWSTAFTLSSDKVYNIITTAVDLQQINKAIQKREPGKVRAVVSADDSSYLRMSYVSTWLESSLKNHPSTPLFLTVKGIVGMYEELASLVNNIDVNVPIDQVHFDWQQTVNMLNAFFVVTHWYISTYCTWKSKNILLYCINNIRISIVQLAPIVLVGKTAIKLIKGFLSGWRWTALMGTIFNYAEFHCALKLSKHLGVKGDLRKLWAQGDDDAVIITNYSLAVSLVRSYQIMGFEVNPSKFFVSLSRNEFLRQVITHNRVSGYPARCILSITDRKPQSATLLAFEERIKETLDLWNLPLSRGLNARMCSSHMVSDLHGQMSTYSKGTIKDWVHTPASLGGGGVSPWTIRFTSLVPAESVSKYKPETALSAASNMVKFFRKTGVTLTNKESLGYIYNSYLTMPHRETTLITKAHFKNIAPQAVPTYPQLGAGTPLSPRSNFSTRIGSELALRKAIDTKNWDWILYKYIHPENLRLATTMFERSSRRVFIDWVSGKLPFNSPVVFGHSKLAVSSVFSEISTQAFGYVVNKYRRISMKNVITAALVAEHFTTEIVSKRTITLAG